MSLKLGDLLGELRSEGEVDSSGAFTMDLKHATEKLQRFQLTNPHHYVLKLIQFAVASGSTQVDVRSNNERVHVRMEGFSFSARELANLFYYLLEASPTHENRALRSLASAVNTAIGMKASNIALESWDGTTGVRHLWSQEGPTQTKLRGGRPGVPHLEFVLYRNLSDRVQGWWNTANRDVFDLFLGRRSAMDREHAAVYDRCKLSPIPITLNGRPLPQTSFGAPCYPGWRPGLRATAPWYRTLADSNYVNGVHKEHHLVELWVACDERHKDTTLRAPQDTFSSVPILFKPTEPFWLALAIPATLDVTTRVNIIEDGVLTDRKHPTGLGTPGVQAVVCGSLFAKDLGSFKVIENELWLDFLQTLREYADELRGELRECANALPGDYPRIVKTGI